MSANVLSALTTLGFNHINRRRKICLCITMFNFIVVFGITPFYFPSHTPTPMEWESSPPSIVLRWALPALGSSVPSE